MKPPSPLVSLLALTSILTGCAVAAVAVGAAAAAYGVIKYTENGAQEDFQADIGKTFEAASEALTHHGYQVPANQMAGKTEGRIRADDAVVELERFHGKGGDFTRVVVTIGTFDTESHRDKAARILGRMRRTLGEG